jgi:hypothetical protein
MMLPHKSLDSFMIMQPPHAYNVRKHEEGKSMLAMSPTTTMFALLLFGVVLTAGSEPRTPTAALLQADLPGAEPRLVDALAAELTAAGYEVAKLSAEALCDPAQVTVERFDLLVLPNAARLPSGSIEPIATYLKNGGDCIFLNAPAWQEPLLHLGGQWTTPEACRRACAADLPEHVVFDFADPNLTGWQRTAYRGDLDARHETIADGPGPNQRALHVVIEELDNWDTYASPVVDHPFPEGRTVTAFSAKGGPSTTQLAVEWQERDGSRWIAVVSLSREWQHYELAPSDFRFWESVPARANDTFHPENAVRMTVGLAFTHTGGVGGRHEYWLGPFGTAKTGSSRSVPLTDAVIPALDTLSPRYKFFDSTDVARVVAAANQDVIVDAAFALPRMIRSPHPRPQAGGFNKGRAWRWMPLLEAQTGDGQWRGNPATLLVHADGPCRGAGWAAFGVADADWYLTREALGAVRAVAQRIADGVFLIDAGADHYTYFDDQDILLGARVANVSKAPQSGLSVCVRMDTVSEAKTVHTTQEWSLDLVPGETATVSESWRPGAWPEKGFLVTAELRRGETVIDRASHEAHVWRPKKAKHFVAVQDSDFFLEGRRWRPHGVNYMPSSGIGTEDWDYFEQWVGARAYDPVVIQRDLEHCRDIGLNAVSIFIYRQSMEAQNLLDLLRRLDQLGLKANLSLRPGTPMDFQWQEMRELIEFYRLRDNDTVFALDLAWEPLFRDFERKPWNAAWEQWILERYGSIENAEKDWEFPVPRDAAGAIVDPDPTQWRTDGPWNCMAAAYRRFLDTLLYDKYSKARRLVRGLDPNHPISFRMTSAGDPTLNWPGCIPYDFAYLAGAVDILEPEAYGRIGAWDRVKPGRFTFEYGRWANAALPLMWAEAGVHAWDMARMEAAPDKLEYQAEFYERIYRMLIDSGADGIFWWWYPGGLRVNENSDYGIMNPDGSDRPVSRVIRDNAQRLADGPDARPVDTWLEMDRDANANGLNGIYDDLKDTFWTAVELGRVPGLRTAGTGTDSANCALLAVGNVPCNGANPPKYLDGFFDTVEVRTANGDWTAVESGATVPVARTKPVRARITLTNPGEAEWLAQSDAPDGQGAVRLVIQGDETRYVALPKPVARFNAVTLETSLVRDGITESTTVTLRLEAAARTPFGPKCVLTLNPT